MLPRILKNLTLYIDGVNMVGRVLSVTLPELSLVEEEYRGGGMDAAVDQDMGMNKLDMSFSLGEYSTEAILQFGLFSASTRITMRGAVQRQGEPAVAAVVHAQGMFKNITRDEMTPGANSTMQITANLNLYQELLAGQELINIDVINMKRIIGGVDRLADQRAALGM